MKRTHLRWFIPMVICVIAVTIAIVTYLNTMNDELIKSKEKEIALAVSDELRQIDVDVSRATSVVFATGNIMSNYRMDDDRERMVFMLENILEESSSNYAVVCDLAGVGFDQNNRDVDVSDQSYFDEISSEYANGGVGMVLPRDIQSSIGEVMLVYGAKFSSRTRGYLIAYLPVRTINEKLYRELFLFDKQAIISLSGDILCSKGFEVIPARVNSVWDKLPSGLSKDTVKLYISQKKAYMGEVPGYGYVIIEPMRAASGGLLVLITEQQMKAMISDSLASGYRFSAAMVMISVAFIILVLLTNIIADHLQKEARRRAAPEKETDIVTGLLAGEETLEQIDSFIAEDENHRGMLFLIGTNITGDKDSARTNDQLREFARVLGKGFRSSDIIGRVGENEFAVFLKDIGDEKAVRKQTDEMQMFLHDVMSGAEIGELTANAEAVLFPNGGRTARDLMENARRALTRARQQGDGRLSF